MLKRTPLFSAQQKLGGKLIEFGGWEMPVQYSSIMDEHLCVRKAAGIFDISHMGEVSVSGTAAAGFLNVALTNDISKLEPGHGQYTLMCNESGGVIDDLYTYRTGRSEFLLVINASRIEPDVAWLEERLAQFAGRADTKLENASEHTAAVAVQGPQVAQFINQCFPGKASTGIVVAQAGDLKKNQIARFDFDGTPLWLGRTGYTGEDGFEIIAPAEIIETVWNKILEIGGPFGLKPCGLGARDTLRTEVCYPLYGHELDENITPIEAGLGFFVAFNKGDFGGRPVLAAQKEKGVSKTCVALK